MVNNLVFRWPKPLFFMVLGAHGSGDITKKNSDVWKTVAFPFQIRAFNFRD